MCLVKIGGNPPISEKTLNIEEILYTNSTLGTALRK